MIWGMEVAMSPRNSAAILVSDAITNMLYTLLRELRQRGDMRRTKATEAVLEVHDLWDKGPRWSP
jgi:hypothetical protein